MEKVKYISVAAITFMTFNSVWGFDSIVNGYAMQGLPVIIRWLFIFTCYFVPYALIVGELGTSFKNSPGGVSSWIKQLIGPKAAFLTGWTFWAIHIPYLAQKPLSIVVAGSWAVFQDDKIIQTIPTIYLQILNLLIFLIILWLSSKGTGIIEKLGTIAGTSILVMSILFIILTLSAPVITDAQTETIIYTWDNFVPKFDFEILTTVTFLVFSVSGCENLSPYINNMNNPSRDYSRAMIYVIIMISVSAILGSFAMGFMFDSNNIPKDLMMNGPYYCFQKLGEYYHIGSTFLIIYAITNMISKIAVLCIYIDAPIKMFLADTDKKLIPPRLAKVNKNGIPINGYWLTAFLASILILLPALGIGDVNELFNMMMKLIAVAIPCTSLWVFVAYMALKRSHKITVDQSAYKFTSNRTVGFLIGLFCFCYTIYACFIGMFPVGPEKFSSEWIFELTLNILTPLLLTAFGFVAMKIAEYRNSNGLNM